MGCGGGKNKQITEPAKTVPTQQQAAPTNQAAPAQTGQTQAAPAQAAPAQAAPAQAAPASTAPTQLAKPEVPAPQVGGKGKVTSASSSEDPDCMYDDANDSDLENEMGAKRGNSGDRYDRNEKKPEDNAAAFACFEEEQAGSGDQALAVKPFTGAIVAPSSPPEFNNSPPGQGLRLEYVYGYRCFDSRQNLFFNSSYNEVVYMTAAIGVVLDVNSNQQKFFGAGDKESAKGHNDDITALTICPQRKLVATGEVGKNPKICVWDSNDPEKGPIKEFRQGRNSRAVTALAFSADGKYLAASALDNDHIVRVWDWQNGSQVAEEKGGPDKILDIAWHPQEKLFMTVGIKHAYFWKLGGSGYEFHKRAIFGKVAPQSNMTCVQFLPNGDALCGGTNGRVYLFDSEKRVLKKAQELHSKAIHSLRIVGNKVYTGGSDNKVNIVSEALGVEKTLNTKAIPRSIDVNTSGDLLLGLRNGEIAISKANGEYKVLMESHSDGEVWGIDICTQNPNVFVTSGDDNKILAWDAQKRQCIGQGVINEKRGPARKAGYGASTLSPLPPNQQARAIAINSQTGHVCLCINDGSWSVRDSVQNLSKEIAQGSQPKEWSQVCKYSPDGSMLAIGSHDNNIYLFDVQGGYKPTNTLKAHNSFIETFDFSACGKYIKSTCGAYELLFFNTQTGQQEKSGASETKDTQWADYSTKFGWHVQGIFQGVIDFTHVNSVDRSTDNSLLAVGNDWGFVTLFNFPCGEGAKGRAHKAHSEHVTNVKWSKGDQRLISAGGYDNTVMQWVKA